MPRAAGAAGREPDPGGRLGPLGCGDVAAVLAAATRGAPPPSTPRRSTHGPDRTACRSRTLCRSADTSQAAPTPPPNAAPLRTGGRDNPRAVCEDPLGQARSNEVSLVHSEGSELAGSEPSLASQAYSEHVGAAPLCSPTADAHLPRDGDPDGDRIQTELARTRARKRSSEDPRLSRRKLVRDYCAASGPDFCSFWRSSTHCGPVLRHRSDGPFPPLRARSLRSTARTLRASASAQLCTAHRHRIGVAPPLRVVALLRRLWPSSFSSFSTRRTANGRDPTLPHATLHELCRRRRTWRLRSELHAVAPCNSASRTVAESITPSLLASLQHP